MKAFDTSIRFVMLAFDETYRLVYSGFAQEHTRFLTLKDRGPNPHLPILGRERRFAIRAQYKNLSHRTAVVVGLYFPTDMRPNEQRCDEINAMFAQSFRDRTEES